MHVDAWPDVFTAKAAILPHDVEARSAREKHEHENSASLYVPLSFRMCRTSAVSQTHQNTPPQAFDAHRDGVKFNAELTRVLTRATAFEAVMRVRATRGLRITNFYGNYFIRGTDLLALPNCTPDSVFAVEFGYDEQLLTASVISIQVKRN